MFELQERALTVKPAKHHLSVVQMCLPHYRLPFFQTLTQRFGGEVTVVAGEHSFLPSPISVEDAPGVNWINAPNYFLVNRLALQKLPGFLRDAPVCILEFNPRILTNLLLLRRRRLPTILWGHGLSPRSSSPAWIRTIRRWTANRAAALIFYSNKGKEDFRSLGIPDAKLFVARNAIDIEHIQSVAAQTSAQRADILFIGRLVPTKKVDLLIAGFRVAVERLPAATQLVVVGDGPERPRLEQMVVASGLTERVQFAGEIIRQEDLAPIFSRSMLSVSPGSTGLAAIHSLAYGVPLLVADNEPHGPEIEVLEHGKTGEWFPANDASALAEMLVQLLGQPQRLMGMGAYGQALVTKQYSTRHMVDVFEEAIRFAAPDAEFLPDRVSLR